jgi:UDP-GlcNAc:undecaprenyl-phosphate GlcNAc-1-phosphate transferase
MTAEQGVRVAAVLAAGGLSLVLTPLIRGAALRRGIVDTVDARKLHSGRIPRLGGVAIVVAFYITAALIEIFAPVNPVKSIAVIQHIAILAGGAFIALLGLYDDLRGANAATKFCIQFVAAVIVYAVGLRIEEVATPFGSFALGWLSPPLTVIWIVGVTNAVNLIDGLDGLAGGVGVIALIGIALLALTSGKPLSAITAVVLAVAILGFLVYNWHPATIFMGDTGSLFIGFFIASVTLIVCRVPGGSTGRVDMLAAVLIVGVPIWDTTLAIVRRSLRGAGVFSADKEHIHHRVLHHGFSQPAAALALYAAMLAFIGIGCVVHHASARLGAIALAATAVAVVAATRALGYSSLMRRRVVLADDAFERALATFAASVCDVVSPNELALRLATFAGTIGLRPKFLGFQVSEGVNFEWAPDVRPRHAARSVVTARAAVVCSWQDDERLPLDRRRRIHEVLTQAVTRLRDSHGTGARKEIAATG